MTQTVSTVKFSTAVTFNSATYTILTAPAGTASRVILNAMNFYIDEGATGVPYFYFMIYNATTGAMVMGSTIRPDNAAVNIDAIAILPGNMTGPVGYGVSSVAVPGGYVIYSATASANSLAARNPSGSGFGISPQVGNGTFFPAQFWMCTGDTFQIKATWGNRSGYMQGSFTIITES